MEDFDWVTARSQCSVARMFHMLRLQVEADVRVRAALPVNADPYEFSTVVNGDHFVVYREGRHQHKHITFKMSGMSIIVSSDDGAVFLDGLVTLNDEGSCRLRVNNVDLALWQFRHRALETLFFGPF